MNIQKRKTHFFSYILILLSAVFTALVISPYFSFEPGSLPAAVIPQLYSVVLSYAGVFRTGIFEFLTPYTLLPALLLMILLTQDSIFSIEFKRRVFHVLFFVGLYFFCEAAQGGRWAFINTYSIYFYYGGISLAALSFLLSMIFQIAELARVWGRRKKESSVPQMLDEEPQLISEEERRIMEMTDEEALKILDSVYVPEFDKYDNYIPDSAILGTGENGEPTFYSIANRISNIQRDNRQKRETAEEIKRNREEAKRARLAEIFKVKYMNREEEEDDIFSDNITIEKDQSVDIQIEPPKPNPQYVPPQVQPQVIYVQQPQPQVIYVQTGNAFPNQVTIPQTPPMAPPVQPQVSPLEEEKIEEPLIEEDFEIEEEPHEEKPQINKDKISSRFDHLYDSQAMKDEGEALDLSPVNNYSGYTVPQNQKESMNGHEDVEMASAVLGLRRAEGQDYLYNAKRLMYKFPPDNLLMHYEQATDNITDVDVENDGRIIVDTLRQFRIETRLLDVKHGPTFTLYELSLARGIRVNTITNLAENIAMDLAVKSVRILAPIPGKAAVGVEVPNKKRYTIGFDMMLPALRKKPLKVPMVLGKTITNDSVVIDLASAPHLLIAGTTGSGKSVCVNSLICSILYTKTPRDVRMLLVDPKMVELTVYNDIPHLLTPVITEPKKAIKAMAYCVQEMERRMNLLSKVGARKIEEYNRKVEEQGFLNAKLPYIVVIVDEFADLMQVVGKELEQYIKRITAVARFTGIHLVLATQRPSVDVITGIIKSNMPTKIAFAVANSMNSRIILDSNGAEKLLGRGDMLYASPSSGTLQRIQGAYIDSEVEDIVAFVKAQEKPDYVDEAYFEDTDEEDEENPNGTLSSLDSGEDLFTKAWHLVAEKGEASASYLQRKLSIGYNRAANLIEQLEEAGYVGPARGGSKPREVLRYPDSQK